MRLVYHEPVLARLLQFMLNTIAPPDPLVMKAELLGADGLLPLSRRSEEYEAIALFPYKNEVIRSALVEIKTHLNKRIVRAVGSAAAVLLEKEIARVKLMPGETRPLLLPVPMTRKSIRERGWNQCELLAKEIARTRNDLVELKVGILVKTRNTGDQVGKSREERRENLSGCFVVRNNSAISGRTVIILDDILTTGATLSEAKRAALDAGAASVLCIAIAH